jgi:carbon storage regulator CsrA
MLILSRRQKEKIYFPSIRTVIHVADIRGKTVRLGIEAPPEVTVLRDELRDRPASATRHVATALGFDQLLQFAASGVEMARLGLEGGRPEVVKELLTSMGEDLARLRDELTYEASRTPTVSCVAESTMESGTK